jgi:hypothetical protein
MQRSVAVLVTSKCCHSTASFTDCCYKRSLKCAVLLPTASTVLNNLLTQHTAEYIATVHFLRNALQVQERCCPCGEPNGRQQEALYTYCYIHAYIKVTPTSNTLHYGLTLLSVVLVQFDSALYTCAYAMLSVVVVVQQQGICEHRFSSVCFCVQCASTCTCNVQHEVMVQ